MTDVVVSAQSEDEDWIVNIFDSNSRILGNMSGRTMIWRWKNSKNSRDRIIVVRNKGFAHYLLRKDGVRTVYELAVHEEHKRRGIGRLLLQAVGRPVILKTDADHKESNSFYLSEGLLCCGKSRSKSGKVMNIYQGW